MKCVSTALAAGLMLLAASQVPAQNVVQAPQAAGSSAPIADRLRAGQPAPDFSAIDRSGKQVRLSDFRGETVVLDMWATWCGPCIAGMPGMEAMHRQLRDRNVVVLALHVMADKAAWEKWLAANPKYTLTFLHDPAGRDGVPNIPGRYGVAGYPTQFVIDKNGILVGQDSGGEGDNPTARPGKSWDGVLGPAKPSLLKLVQEASLPVEQRRSARGGFNTYMQARMAAARSAGPHPGDAAYEAMNLKTAVATDNAAAEKQAETAAQFILDFPTHPRLVFLGMLMSGQMTRIKSPEDPQLVEHRRLKFQQAVQARLARPDIPAAAAEQLALMDYELALTGQRQLIKGGKPIDTAVLTTRIDRLSARVPGSPLLKVMEDDLALLMEDAGSRASATQ